MPKKTHFCVAKIIKNNLQFQSLMPKKTHFFLKKIIKKWVTFGFQRGGREAATRRAEATPPTDRHKGGNTGGRSPPK